MTITDEAIDRIAQRVAALGWSKAELARRAGVHRDTIRRIGRNDWSPSTRTLRRIEEALAREQAKAA